MDFQRNNAFDSTEFSLSTCFQKRFVFIQLNGSIQTVGLNNHWTLAFGLFILLLGQIIILIQGKFAFKRKIHTFLKTLGKLSF